MTEYQGSKQVATQVDLRPALIVTGVVRSPNEQLWPDRGIPELYPTNQKVSDSILNLCGLPREDLAEILKPFNGRAVISGTRANLTGQSVASSALEGSKSTSPNVFPAGQTRINSIYETTAPILYPLEVGGSDLDVIVFDTNIPEDAIPCRSIKGGWKKSEIRKNYDKPITINYLFAPSTMVDPSKDPRLLWYKYFTVSGHGSCLILHDKELDCFLPGGIYGTLDRSFNIVFSPETKLDPTLGAWAVRHALYMAYFHAVDNVDLSEAVQCAYKLVDIGSLTDEAYESLGELLNKLIPALRNEDLDDFFGAIRRLHIEDIVSETLAREKILAR